MSMRKLKRQIQRNSGEYISKKAVAKKLGISVSELNRRLKKREHNLEQGGLDHGKE